MDGPMGHSTWMDQWDTVHGWTNGTQYMDGPVHGWTQEYGMNIHSIVAKNLGLYRPVLVEVSEGLMKGSVWCDGGLGVAPWWP